MDYELSNILSSMLKELKEINRKLDNIDSNTSGTESNVSSLEYKFDEIKTAIEEKE